MSKQERIAECEEIIESTYSEIQELEQGLYDMSDDNELKLDVHTELNNAQDYLTFYRNELETAQAMPDDTPQVSEAETFLHNETDKLDVPCSVRETIVSDYKVIGVLDVNEWGYGKISIDLSPDGSYEFHVQPFHANNITDFADFIALQKVAGEIALKWQAHVAQQKEAAEKQVLYDAIELTPHQIRVIKKALKKTKLVAVRAYRDILDTPIPLKEMGLHVDKVIAMIAAESRKDNS